MPKPRVIGKLMPGMGYNGIRVGSIYRTLCLKCFTVERRWGYITKKTKVYDIREGQLGLFRAKCYICKIDFCNGSSNLPLLFNDENDYPLHGLPEPRTIRRRARRARS